MTKGGSRRRMGGANGSRECAPDDRLRDTHHRSCVIDGFRRVSHRAPIRATVGSTQGEEYTMKLVYFDDFKLGVLQGDTVVDVSAEVNDIPHTGPGDLMNG